MTQMEELHLHSLARSEPAQKLPLNISRYPKLEKNQAGHIRHFHNLTAQLDGEWHHMGVQEPGQEFLDALRYQLATMAYATGVTHYHHLPLLRTVFKPLIRKLIYKMLRREVWGYWFNTSLSGSRVDPSLKELRKPWADPVIKENIMYSGHLLLMTSLYAMLFDDDEFEKPGSLSFQWDPIFFGFGTEIYEYDNASLQNVILKEMEANGWMGVCCEPNLVFVVCNQFPMIAMRYNDVRHGTKTIDEVLPKYKAAWAKKSMVGSNGQVVNNWMVKQNNINPSPDLGFSAWTNAFMNTWNSEFVYATYASQSLGFIVPTPDNNQYVPLPSHQALAFRNLVTTENADPKDPLTLAKAKEIAAQKPLSKFPYNAPQLGYICKWLSELGKTNELRGLLAYIDTHLDPTWENGGLFYPRHDKLMDEEGNWTHMDPFSGNAAIGYARLNVKDGQKCMWERPWTRQEVARRPYVECRGLESGVDFFRGAWDGEEEACVVTMRSWDGRRVAMGLQFRQLEKGDWAVYVDGELRGVQSVQAGESVIVEVDVGAEEVDVVIMKCRS